MDAPPRAPGSVRLIHFSAPWCPRCPACHDAVARLHAKWGFDWLHITLPHDAQEEYNITKLPAVAVESDQGAEVIQPCDEAALNTALMRHVRLDTEAEF